MVQLQFLQILLIYSGVARPGPTRACALPSTFQALPSAAQYDSRDSIKKLNKKGNTVGTRLDISLLHAASIHKTS